MDRPQQPSPHDSGPDSSDVDNSLASDDDDASYDNWFKALSKEWLHSQLHHHVSLTASNAFWNLSLKYIPKLIEMKKIEANTKKIPQFLQVSNLNFKNFF